MLVCEVALGNIANYPENWSCNVYRPPEGCHSVRIMTGYGPDFRHNTYYRISDFSDRLLPYPVIVPIGSFIKYPAPKVQSGQQHYKEIKNFAEYLEQQKEINKKASKAKGKKKPTKKKGKKN